MDVCLLCFYVVLSCVGRGLWDGLITHPEESYRVSKYDHAEARGNHCIKKILTDIPSISSSWELLQTDLNDWKQIDRRMICKRSDYITSTEQPLSEKLINAQLVIQISCSSWNLKARTKSCIGFLYGLRRIWPMPSHPVTLSASSSHLFLQMTVLLLLLMEDVIKMLHHCKPGDVGTLLLQRSYSHVLTAAEAPFTRLCCSGCSHLIVALSSLM
jgi:hypothetical protein